MKDRDMTTVGFVGLGAIGAPMAWNLDDAGFDLTVYNRTTERELFSGARGRGHGDEDVAAVVRYLEAATGVEVRADESA